MKFFGIERFEQRPFLHGFATGYGLPFLIVAAPLAMGRLDRLLVEGWIYFLMPVFAALGIASFLLMRWLYDVYEEPARGVRFSTGCLAGGWCSGALLLWLAAPDRPFANRALLAVAGGPLLVAFWLWAGALVAYAVQQRRHEMANGVGHVEA